MLIFNNATAVVGVASAGVGLAAVSLGAPWYPFGVAAFLGGLLVLGAIFEHQAPRVRFSPPRLYWIIPLWFGGLLGLATLCYYAGPRPLGLALLGVCGVLAVRFVQHQSTLPGGRWFVVAVAALGAQIGLELAEDAGHALRGLSIVRPVLGGVILMSFLICGIMRYHARDDAPTSPDPELPRAKVR